MRSVIETKEAAPAVGPYSQAIRFQDLVFVSGQLPIDPVSGELADGIEGQTHRSLKNLQAILIACGASLSSVVKTTVFLKNMTDFAAMNRIYGEQFGEAPPARSTVEVARLPRDALVEIEAIAIVERERAP